MVDVVPDNGVTERAKCIVDAGYRLLALPVRVLELVSADGFQVTFPERLIFEVVEEPFVDVLEVPGLPVLAEHCVQALAEILDTFSRKTVGWSIDTAQDTKLVINALDMALKARRPPAGGIVLADSWPSRYSCVEQFGARGSAPRLIVEMNADKPDLERERSGAARSTPAEPADAVSLGNVLCDTFLLTNLSSG